MRRRKDFAGHINTINNQRHIISNEQHGYEARRRLYKMPDDAGRKTSLLAIQFDAEFIGG